MRIVINALPARVGAGVTFYHHFLPELGKVDPKNEYIILLYSDQAERFTNIPPQFRKVVVRAPRNFAGRALWEQFVLPIYLAIWRADILYSQGNFTTLFAPCKTVVVITGANPYSSLRVDPWQSRLKHRLIALASLLSARRATRIVFISYDARENIRELLGVPMSQTAVVYYGWSPDENPSQPAGRDRGGYILTVSVLWRHKNFERLMKAFDELVRIDRYRGRLVIAGAVHSVPYYESLKALRDSLPSADRIEFTEAVSSERLRSLYASASLFVFPSVEETLGLPLLEAMGAGLPIAASDCTLAGRNGARYFSPSREICGDAAVYFNPFDETSIRAAMRALVSDPLLAKRLAERGPARVQQFTWERTARETATIFNDIGAA